MENLEQNQAQRENMEQEPKYDALVVMGAVMRWDEKNREWIFPTIMEKEEYIGRLVMGKARALAAKEIHNDANLLLVTGGSDKHPETGESHSRSVELTKLITGRYKVPEEKVVAMGKSKSSHTLGNAHDVAEYLASHPEVVQLKKLCVLSPRFQSDRAKYIFGQEEYFKEHGIGLDFMIVEDVIGKIHPMGEEWDEAVYATEEYKNECKPLEEQGLRQLKEKTYKPKQ